jgi:hypothetical protein
MKSNRLLGVIASGVWIVFAGLGSLAWAQGTTPGGASNTPASAPASDYAYRVPLEAAGGQAFYRAELSAAVVGGTVRRDLADLRVVNGAGEPVPFAFTSGGERAPTALQKATLPMFPIYGESGATTTVGGGLELSIKQGADGSLVSLKSTSQTKAVTNAGANSPPVDYWLLDAVALNRAVSGFAFQWPAQPQGVSTSVRVEASDDLKNWRVVAERAPLVDLRMGERALRHDTIGFAASQAKYWKVSVDGRALRLSNVEALYSGEEAEAPRRVASVAGVVDEKNKFHYTFDLGAALPVERVKLILPERNTLAPVTFATRNEAAQAWSDTASTVVFRLASAGGAELLSPATATRATARYWQARFDPASGGIGSGAVNLEVEYTPRYVVFVARGNGPFAIEYGQRAKAGEKDNRNSPALALSSVMPNYRTGDEWKLPEAKAGAPATVNAKAAEKTLATEVNTNRLVLWGVLLFAVLLLGLMAWKMMKPAKEAAK